MFFLKSVKTFGLIFHTFSIKIGIYLKSAHKPQSLIMEKYQNYWRKHLSRWSPISSTKIISGRNILEVGAKSKSRISITFVRHLIVGVPWLRQVLWYYCKKMLWNAWSNKRSYTKYDRLVDERCDKSRLQRAVGVTSAKKWVKKATGII